MPEIVPACLSSQCRQAPFCSILISCFSYSVLSLDDFSLEKGLWVECWSESKKWNVLRPEGAVDLIEKFLLRGLIQPWFSAIGLGWTGLNVTEGLIDLGYCDQRLAKACLICPPAALQDSLILCLQQLYGLYNCKYWELAWISCLCMKNISIVEVKITTEHLKTNF